MGEGVYHDSSALGRVSDGLLSCVFDRGREAMVVRVGSVEGSGDGWRAFLSWDAGGALEEVVA